MPPAVVPLALVAIGVPAAVRAVLGRPRSLGAAWLAAVGAVVAAQTIGELSGSRLGVLGDAQVLLAALAALITSAAVALREGAWRGR